MRRCGGGSRPLRQRDGRGEPRGRSAARERRFRRRSGCGGATGLAPRPGAARRLRMGGPRGSRDSSPLGGPRQAAPGGSVAPPPGAPRDAAAGGPCGPGSRESKLPRGARPPSRLRQGTEGKKRVEQDERAGQRRTRPRLGCKRVDAALGTGAGVARRPRSQTRQRVGEEGEEGLTTAARCSSLTASALRIPRIPATQSMGR